jgi:uncharacterized protein YbjT (DUF2867 family)
MEQEKNIAAVAGATGRTGSLIVRELLQQGYRVRAMVRVPARAAGLRQQGCDVVEADITAPESLEHALRGAAFLISAIGSRKPFNSSENNRVDNQGNQNLAGAGLKAGVRHMVVISSIGVGNSSTALNFVFRILMGPVLRRKAMAERFITACGISYTIIRPGGLSDKDIPGEIAFGEGGHITGMVSRQQIARVCVAALTNPAMKNRVFEVVAAATLKQQHLPYVIKI